MKHLIYPNELIAKVAVIFSFFPFITPVYNGMDSQPYSLIFVLVSFFLFSKDSIPYPTLFLISVLYFLIAISMFVFDALIYEFSFEFVRNVANYLSLCILPFYYIMYIRKYSFPKGIFIFSSLLYFFAAIVQQVLEPEIFNFLVHSRTTETRGVTSLTPEPTHYGFVCFIFLMIVQFSGCFSKKEKIILNFFFVLQILFLAKSSMTVLFLMLFYLYYFIIRDLSLNKFLFAIAFVIVFNFSIEFLEGSRVYEIYNNFIDVGYLIFKYDASMNDRLSHIYLSLYGFFNNGFLPNLQSEFYYLTENKFNLSDGFFWYGLPGTKIMSYIGSIVFQTGFLGVLYLILLFYYMGSSHRTFLIFVMIPILFSAIPLSLPLIPFLFAIMLTENN